MTGKFYKAYCSTKVEFRKWEKNFYQKSRTRNFKSRVSKVVKLKAFLEEIIILNFPRSSVERMTMIAIEQF